MKRQDSQSRKNKTKHKKPTPRCLMGHGGASVQPSPAVRLAAAAGHTEMCCATCISDLNGAFSRKN